MEERMRTTPDDWRNELYYYRFFVEATEQIFPTQNGGGRYYLAETFPDFLLD